MIWTEGKEKDRNRKRALVLSSECGLSRVTSAGSSDILDQEEAWRLVRELGVYE